MRKILFIHLAKTGGTSVRRLFQNHPQLHSFDCIHNGVFIRFRDGVRIERCPLIASKLTRYDVAILMVRHPLARLLSCYNYFLAGGRNQLEGKERIFPHGIKHQTFLLEKAPNFLECCQNLSEISRNIPHFQPVCHWLDQIPNPPADLVLTGRQERFDADLAIILELLNVKNIGDLTKRHNQSRPSHQDPWCSESRRLAAVFYRGDFQRFGYALR